MRRAVFVALAIGVPASAVAQQRVDRRMAINADASIRVFNLAGSTRIVGWDRDSLWVTGTVPKAAGRFFVGGDGAGAKVGVLGDSLGAAGATLEIHVPRGAKVWVKSASASVTVSAIDGELDISSVGGNVAVDGAPRRLTVEAMDGAIDLTTRSPYTRAKTAGGAITINGGGGDLLASSVSGTIRYLAAHKVLVGRLESVTGSIDFQGTIMRGGTLDIETHDGAVALAVPRDQLADFDVTTFGGTYTNALRQEEPRLTRGRPVHFSTGSGGAAVTVRSFKGDVRVSPI